MYGVEEDCTCFLQRVFCSGNIKIVPNLRYSKPDAFSFDSDSPALRLCLKQTRLLYLRGAFCQSPLFFESLDDGWYFISGERSGAMISLSLPGMENEHDGVLLRPGNLSRPTRFWDSEYSAATRAPESLKKTFLELVTELKCCLVKHHIGRPVWIGAHAFELLRQGNAKILFMGNWWTIRQGVARKVKRTGF